MLMNKYEDDADAQAVGDDALAELEGGDAAAADVEVPDGTVGFTHFDAPGTADDELTMLVPRDKIELVTSGMMVRVESPADPRRGAAARTFLAAVTAGPFAEPTGLKVETPVVVATTLGGRATLMLPRYHGRATLKVTAELDEGGRPVPPRRRPRPNSPVVPLGDDETRAALKLDGDVRLGALLAGAAVAVNLDSRQKNQLPRHLGILGTTGGGKSNTVAVAVDGVVRAGGSVVLLDVEGEYVDMDRPCDDAATLELLAAAGVVPRGVGGRFAVLHPVGRQTAREGDRAAGVVRPFSLRFADLSPYAVMDILDLSDAQQQRFLKAYDALKLLMRDLDIFPKKGDADDYKKLVDLDELDGGFPRMTLAMLRDVANVCCDYADRGEAKGRKKDDDGDFDLSRPLYSPELKGGESRVRQAVARSRMPGNYVSWISLMSKLNRVARLGVFDNPKAAPIDPAALTAPGRVSVIDLSDTDSPAVNNLVIAGVLRAVQRRQESDFDAAQRRGERPSPTLVVIEEAHEFLSAARLKQQPHLFDQVARIAKRGRKRWLGLAFVTQLPQHLPDEVLGLVNNYVLHAVRDPSVAARLGRQVPGLDAGQWARLPSLAPGQAVVSLTTAARPVLAQVDPAACKLRLVG